jgi:hypothetical protein
MKKLCLYANVWTKSKLLANQTILNLNQSDCGRMNIYQAEKNMVDILLLKMQISAFKSLASPTMPSHHEIVFKCQADRKPRSDCVFRPDLYIFGKAF